MTKMEEWEKLNEKAKEAPEPWRSMLDEALMNWGSFMYANGVLKGRLRKLGGKTEVKG